MNDFLFLQNVQYNYLIQYMLVDKTSLEKLVKKQIGNQKHLSKLYRKEDVV